MRGLLDVVGLIDAKLIATPMTLGKLLSKVGGHVLINPLIHLSIGDW